MSPYIFPVSLLLTVLMNLSLCIDIDISVSGDSSVHLENLENETVTINTQQGKCTLGKLLVSFI